MAETGKKTARLPELLAPAGSFEALRAAVAAGADAVYFGGREFSARAGAENFDREGLIRAIAYCRERGYGIVQNYCGHGIGREVHEDPEVPNHGRAGHGMRLVEGMTICIEPMINLVGDDVHTLKNGWTVVTDSGSWSAHFEHMIAITENGPQILTKR